MKKFFDIFYNFGKYFIFLYKVIAKPEKAKPYFSQIIRELDKIGVNSIGITLIISIFMGAVITLQTAYNFTNPIIPKTLIGYGARDSMILEFSSTMLCLILAGKVGSNIASELGTMRITQQIDALEIMGINSAGYLVLPKIIASLFFFPILSILSMVIGIFGGWLVAYFTDAVNVSIFTAGLKMFFEPFYVSYSLIKVLFFAFIISSVSSYHGYYVNGGSVEVGKASTRAVVISSIFILMFNVILTQLLLA
ncbi:MAG TPA: ABC transporter permease [Bacteroidetes bacterium]|nr:ABC transporter permease [Bacteroidota bacterium]